jgi:hypothetical protein
MKETVVVAGAVAQRPGRGGHASVYLQYLLGFRRLGYDVLFLDRLSREMLGPEEQWPPAPQSPAVAWLRGLMEAHGLEGSYALLLDGEEATVGVCRRTVGERLGRAVLLLDVMGFLGDEDLLAAASRRVFLDIDPGFPQMWQALGLHDSLGAHDAYVTVGLRVGEPESTVPTCGVEWVRTLQPVVLEHWPAAAGGVAYTSVVSWRGPFGPVEFGGETYGLRAHQMRRFAELPSAVGLPMELALDIDPADSADADLLRAGGWRMVEPDDVAGTLDRYRRYVQGSRGEMAVAKDMYVRSRGGWFSDRSACYLASGKPVVAQATGFERELETGEGLIAFETPEQAATALREVEGDFDRHCGVARELAEQHFDSDRVLARLLEAVA